MPVGIVALTIGALIVGALITLQAPINAAAASALGHPLAGAALSFCVGTAALLLLVLLVARHSVDLSALRRLPLYVIFSGGLLGAIYVTGAIVLTPRIGIAAFMALAIAGQLVASMIIDRLGLFGLVERDLTAGRVGGALLVFIGALMVRLL